MTVRRNHHHVFEPHSEAVCQIDARLHREHGAHLGDVVFVELPKPGRKLVTGQPFGSVESAKSVSELFSPVAGEVTEVNAALEDSPEVINDDPYGAGWMIRVRLEPGFDPSGLLRADAYRAAVS